jgi:hypothetical protein
MYEFFMKKKSHAQVSLENVYTYVQIFAHKNEITEWLLFVNRAVLHAHSGRQPGK